MNNVLFTKVSFFRNLKDYKFSNKLNENQKLEITDKLKQVFQGKLTYADLSTTDENTLKFLLSNKLIKNNSKVVFYNLKDKVCVDLFNNEHLTINATSIGYNKSSFEKAKNIIGILSSNVNLSFSDEYGYLMSDISKIGAGLQLESEICLSSIKAINKIEQVKQNVRKLGYKLIETEIDNIYKISTICNLGFAEKEIFEEFEKIVAKLQDLEIESLKLLSSSNYDQYVDKVQRSYAILNSAYLLNSKELSQLLLNLRIGLNLGVLDIDIEKINKLQALSNLNNSEINSQTELKQLASNVKNILKGE